ncbi:hypothetical protein IQ07DRAFT_392863 [Pyrenochaeta sp. DS3sAY3a]|nr:hypothetical protein IQ07DRAFT_392863 [Pyrenochaeta sp. DS3sAY3a]
MAPRPTNVDPTSAASPTLAASIPQESQTGLPGMKRGIAIGVACSVAVLLVALVAFFAYKRRARIALEKQRQEFEKQSKANHFDHTASGVWPEEKNGYTELPSPLPLSPPVEAPPVEADTRTIYEMDASQIPELPSPSHVQELETGKKRDRDSWWSDDDAAYTQKLKQWQTWNTAINAHNETQTNKPASPRQLPLLTISPPEAGPGDVSPLLPSQWDTASQCNSPLSPLPDAHLPLQRHEDWNR